MIERAWAGFGLMMMAGFSGTAFAAPCQTATSNAICTVEDKTFSNFIYGSQGIFPVAATAATVTPVLVPNDPG